MILHPMYLKFYKVTVPTRNQNSKKQNRVRKSTGAHECIEAFFYGSAYAPHRHDTYTFALTTHGVQSFNYRGTLRHSMPGKAVILHPDELHDGQAGTRDGFGYRSICIPPTALQNALEGRTLPFVKTGVSTSPRLISILNILMSDLDTDLDNAEFDDAIFDLASELRTLSGVQEKIRSIEYEAVKVAQEYIDGNVIHGFSMSDLEHQTGQSRWQISRNFRAFLGTSPYRYLIMRRLDRARRMLLKGHSLTDAAYACSFSDQSHFNRHFRKTYGLTPNSWLTSFAL